MKNWRNALCLIAVIGLAAATATPAFAKKNSGGHNGFDSSGQPHGFSQGQKHGWNGAGTPPGWTQGKKKGWNGGTMPPGWSR
ncbi:MAG TPA: hypothetical protein VGQ90_14740 [Stellaceae bacterium]|jgi:hypothetical protein|nr:hypothetical protein [Stellaceae bacterium]